jgi:hypothetical protein
MESSELLGFEHRHEEIDQEPHRDGADQFLEHGSLPLEHGDEKGTDEKGTHHDADVKQIRHGQSLSP